MAMAHTSRAAVAAIACLLMLIGTAPSAAQLSTPGSTPTPGAATGNTSALTSAKAVHTISPTPEIIKSAARQERALQLTPAQGAAVVQRATSSPAPESASADGASYAPRTGAATPVPVGQGTSGFSFSDARAGKGAAYYSPFVRASGLLLFTVGSDWFQCTASLIGKSLIVTAGHCVSDFAGNFYTNHLFVPDYEDGKPYSLFDAVDIVLSSSYHYGTDTCDPDAIGVVCNNDVALIWLNLGSDGKQAFQSAGNRYLSYMTNAFEASIAPGSGWASVTPPKFLAVTQLGYPVAFDNGAIQQISTSPGFQLYFSVGSNTLKNIVRGTAMTGGSSGGPWILNFGQPATTSETYGTVAFRNVIIGVTSWGYTDSTIKIQGASMFATNNEFPNTRYGIRGGGNIGALMDFACEYGWNLQAQGYCR